MTAPIISVLIPIRTVNELNDHRHWRIRQRRAKAQRAAAFAHVRGMFMADMVRNPTGRFVFSNGGRIRLTRLAPSSGLDAHDGLPASVKHLVDGVADAFDMKDNDPRLRFEYAQEKCKRGSYGVRVEIWALATHSPEPQ